MIDIDRAAAAADARIARETLDHFDDDEDEALTCIVVECDSEVDDAESVCDGCRETRLSLLTEAAELFADEWLTQEILRGAEMSARRGDLKDFWRRVAQPLT